LCFCPAIWAKEAICNLVVLFVHDCTSGFAGCSHFSYFDAFAINTPSSKWIPPLRTPEEFPLDKPLLPGLFFFMLLPDRPYGKPPDNPFPSNVSG